MIDTFWEVPKLIRMCHRSYKISPIYRLESVSKTDNLQYAKHNEKNYRLNNTNPTENVCSLKGCIDSFPLVTPWRYCTSFLVCLPNYLKIHLKTFINKWFSLLWKWISKNKLFVQCQANLLINFKRKIKHNIKNCIQLSLFPHRWKDKW